VRTFGQCEAAHTHGTIPCRRILVSVRANNSRKALNFAAQGRSLVRMGASAPKKVASNDSICRARATCPLSDETGARGSFEDPQHPQTEGGPVRPRPNIRATSRHKDHANGGSRPDRGNFKRNKKIVPGNCMVSGSAAARPSSGV